MDLQPYVCTFEDCGIVMFPDRRTWADHEMQVHRRDWQCNICREEKFDSSSALQSHVTLRHENFAKSEQIKAFLETCSRPVEIKLWYRRARRDLCNYSSVYETPRRPSRAGCPVRTPNKSVLRRRQCCRWCGNQKLR